LAQAGQTIGMTVDVQHTDTLSSRVAEELRALLGRRRLSGRELARRLDVSPNWVSLRMTGAQPIDLNDLDRISRALGVRPVDLLRAAETVATVQYPDEVTETVAPRPMPRRPPMRHDSRGPGSGRTARTRPPNAG
jgi:transcriptional regulator with XRE-family HTH domain